MGGSFFNSSLFLQRGGLMVMKTIPVVIIQTDVNRIGALVCMSKLSKARFIPGTDFVVCERPEDAELYLTGNSKQLLVTGTFQGNEVAASIFARRWKTRNAYLTTMFFSNLSVSNVPGMWNPGCDIHVRKGTGDKYCEGLINEMQAFFYQTAAA
jgi:hypothetical protein